ncbi:MAG: PaaI family thioesterase [Opitutaceae bacterium]|nr:PaaI family thioesterase [Opitutaceae bacterium]
MRTNREARVAADTERTADAPPRAAGGLTRRLSGSTHPSGLGVDFTVESDGAVRGTWRPLDRFESYVGVLHGGVTATLLDSAMNHVLTVRGIIALTGELNVRFRRVVRTDAPVEVRAWLERAHGALMHLAAELCQDGVRCARGTARFMRVSDTARPADGA